jgi:hypothetical protein
MRYFILPMLFVVFAEAVPISVVFEGDLGTRTLILDFQRQPAPFVDIHDLSGDYLLKQSEYRINHADYFHAGLGSSEGHGYDWILERYPPGLGIYEEYSQIFIPGANWQPDDPNGDYLEIWGPLTSHWRVGSEFAWATQENGVYQFATMRIASMDPFDRDFPPAESVPEPGSVALILSGLAWLAVRRARRR